jgi:hypothetical protein
MRFSPITPDGRYFVVKGRLWRCTIPSLSSETKELLVRELMQARSLRRKAMRNRELNWEGSARQQVDEAKHRLGERGLVWWMDRQTCTD